MERNSNKQNEIPLQQVESFVKENIADSVNGRVCVDGRYASNGTETGFLARAGADFGIIMGLLALKKQGKINVTVQEAVDTVYNFTTEEEGKFYLHTDQHSIEGQTLTGCGHIRLASNPDYSDRFGVNATETLEALRYIRDKRNHPKIEEVVLQGDHKEKGNLIIRGTEQTLKHQDNDTRSQYFVYDKDRDIDLIQNFVTNSDILGLNFEDLLETLDTQTKATLDLLAPENLTFEVDLEGETPKISLVPVNS